MNACKSPSKRVCLTLSRRTIDILIERYPHHRLSEVARLAIEMFAESIDTCEKSNGRVSELPQSSAKKTRTKKPLK